jgi:hypothetical protein
MRRLLVVVSTLAVLGSGFFFIPAQAKPASTPADALTGGTVTVVVGRDPANGVPAWTTTISGQVAAGGRTYSGTASGLADEDDPNAYGMDFSGSSATGSIAAFCAGNFVQGPDGGASFSHPAGVLVANCSVSIDGAPGAGLQLVLALAPTANPATFTGVFGGASSASLPALPVGTFGFAGASTFEYSFSNISFAYSGQISVGGQMYRGPAFGSTDDGATDLVGGVHISQVPPFALTGSSSTGTLNATCSGEFVGENVPVVPAGVGLSILSCDGSANGGPVGSVTLVSVYPLGSGWVQQPKGMSADYTGVFLGI